MTKILQCQSTNFLITPCTSRYILGGKFSSIQTELKVCHSVFNSCEHLIINARKLIFKTKSVNHSLHLNTVKVEIYK